MKIVFFGLGSIGRRHAKLLQMGFDYELFAFRSNENSKGNDLGISEFYDLKDIEKINPDVAFITNPTSEHLKYAIYCAERGISIFLEKPFSNTDERLQELVNIMKKNKVQFYIAYCLRFHPVIKWLKENLAGQMPTHITVSSSSYLPNWRKGVNHIESYSSQKSKGGGVILDLSHELDYLYYLFGNCEILAVNSKKVANVTVDAEDFADILLEFKKIPCNLHLNFLSRVNRREIIINFKNKSFVADLLKSEVTQIKEDGTKETIKFNFEADDMYKKQLRYFFDNLNNQKLMNGVNEAIKVFDLVMRVKEAVV